MEKKVGLIGLIALVVGSMIGGGIFQLPSEMAQAGGPIAAMIAWVITGIGMFFLGKVFQILNEKRPDLSGGIYTYAREGFGKYVGFNSAWGYWLSQTLGNVSYAVLFIYALKSFFPEMGGVDSWTGLIIATIMIWGAIVILVKSMAVAEKLNTIATVCKILPVIMAIILLIISFKLHIFTSDLWAANTALQGGQNLGGIGTQVQNGLLQTVWVFIGIESAVVISGRAKKASDVGKATIIGYLFTFICYVLIVLLSFGALPQDTLINLQNPALGGVLQKTWGTWAAVIINLGVLISVAGAWIAWTIINAEVPMTVAQDKVFPKGLAKTVKSGAAINSLILNGVIMEIGFIFAMFASNAFTAITNIATAMVLLPYILSAAFLIKLCWKEEKRSWAPIIYSVISMLFALYALSTSGITGILELFILYAFGWIFVFIRAKEQKNKMFDTKWELGLCIGIMVIACCAIAYLVVPMIK
ncbi:basic amino acid/polyamine antiporter [Clostridium massiliamazoniense]|uniref:basic amino acid/polyamine antiporter n=1 Tax=Clostridium massiliamazoniense TaxID=1347366 RepID=UPI000B0A805E|nr:basic amino acid/polyamine antiporter [Clostridium massiliamazoniense]